LAEKQVADIERPNSFDLEESIPRKRLAGYGMAEGFHLDTG
jgi:hypothetical protein